VFLLHYGKRNTITYIAFAYPIILSEPDNSELKTFLNVIDFSGAGSSWKFHVTHQSIMRIICGILKAMRMTEVRNSHIIVC
jgi:hypothetical protein